MPYNRLRASGRNDLKTICVFYCSRCGGMEDTAGSGLAAKAYWFKSSHRHHLFSCWYGEMADALALGTSAFGRVGSTPTASTNLCVSDGMADKTASKPVAFGRAGSTPAWRTTFRRRGEMADAWTLKFHGLSVWVRFPRPAPLCRQLVLFSCRQGEPTRVDMFTFDVFRTET